MFHHSTCIFMILIILFIFTIAEWLNNVHFSFIGGNSSTAGCRSSVHCSFIRSIVAQWAVGQVNKCPELPGQPNLKWVSKNFLGGKGSLCDIDHTTHRLLIGLKMWQLAPYMQFTSQHEKRSLNSYCCCSCCLNGPYSHLIVSQSSCWIYLK